MPSLEKRAWLMLCSMLPAYLFYFGAQWRLATGNWSVGQRLLLLGAAAGVHGVAYLAGLAVMKLRQPSEGLHEEDERDRSIDGRATRIAYFLLLTGMLMVGVVMPFGAGGWELINASLMVVVAVEAIRHGLIVSSYRWSRLAL